MSECDEERTPSSIHRQLADAVERLSSAGARDETLARLEIPRGVLFIRRKAAFVPIGRVWRLGVFLLGRDGTLHETGSITRAVEPGYPGHQSNSAELRKALKSAALKGPFAPGETVNYDAREIVLEAEALRASTGPLFAVGEDAMVRWSRLPNAKPVDFAGYLNERVNSLAHPPEGA